MNDTSRRKFLAATGVGATAGAVGLATGLTGGSASAETSGRTPGSATEPVVAFVEDPKADKVVLMFGEREVVVRDRDLARRIAKAAGGN